MQTVTEKPQEVLKMFTFKPTPLTQDKSEMYTVIATTLEAATQKAPDMKSWYLHSVQKDFEKVVNPI